MIDGQRRFAQDASILSSTRQTHIIKHVWEALQGEMGIMHTQLREVTSKHDALDKELDACQANCLRLEQDIITQQQVLQETFARAIKVKIT